MDIGEIIRELCIQRATAIILRRAHAGEISCIDFDSAAEQAKRDVAQWLRLGADALDGGQTAQPKKPVATPNGETPH